MPAIWRILWAHTQGRIDLAGTVVTALGMAGMLVLLIMRCRRFLPFVGLLALFGVYVYLLMFLSQSPAERFHLAEYGLLGFFIFRALRLDVPPVAAYFVAWGIAIVLGMGDEGIQWVLPNRVFEWKDVGINALSSGLGLLAVAILNLERP
jgi:hypothetical protein